MTQADSAASDSSPVRLLSRAAAEKEDRVYWHSKTPAERLATAKQLRQIAYGYDPLPPEFKKLLSALSSKKVEYLIVGDYLP